MERVEATELAKFLSTKRHNKFEWGINDCNTLIVDMHDALFGTLFGLAIKGKYTSKIGAYKFQHRFQPAPDWLAMVGYKQVDTIENGDVVVAQYNHKLWHGLIALEGYLYTFKENDSFCKTAIEEFEGDYTVWRHERWLQ